MSIPRRSKYAPEARRCENPECGALIEWAQLIHGGHGYVCRYCSRECVVAHRKARGDYQRMSKAGNDAQAVVIAQTGHAPKYEVRRLAVAKSNRDKPRRRQRKDEE